MPPTPQEPTTLAARARLLTRETRRAAAYASLSTLHARTPDDVDDPAFLADDASDAPPPPVMLFALPDMGCAGCGTIVAEGQAYCRACDPRTA